LEVEVKRRYCPLWSTVRKLLQRGSFDLIHSHGLTAAAHAAFANMWFNIPHVVTSHDVFRPNQTTGCSNRIKLCLLCQLLHSVDAIVSCTKQAQNNLLKQLPAVRRGHVRNRIVENGIDLAHCTRLLSSASNSRRSTVGIDHRTRLFGFLG